MSGISQNPYTEGSEEHRIWIEAASAALTAVQIVGAEGGEYTEDIREVVMDAERAMGLSEDDDDEEAVDGASRLTYGEMRTRAQRIYDKGVKEKVLAGLAALNEEFGDKWVDKIDCRKLNLSDGSQCVLGQVYGEFDDGVVALCGDLKWAGQHGFYDDDGDYDPLDDAWHEVLCDKESS